jgi:hypothetical protein
MKTLTYGLLQGSRCRGRRDNLLKSLQRLHENRSRDLTLAARERQVRLEAPRIL